MDTAAPDLMETMEWTAHPLREFPRRAIFASLVILASGLLVAMAVPDVTAGVLAGGGAMIFLFFMSNRFFLPSRYRLDQHGIAVRYPVGSRSLRWKDLRRFPHDESGGYLSTRTKRGMFDSRGISVFFAGRGPEIITRIKGMMAESEGERS